ncbi:hypothetical protein CP10743SC13_1582, partial [Chlamydia psittaci 10_743_SC13]
TRFLFANPPFNQKTKHFLFSRIPHLTRKSCVFSKPPFKRKSHVFPSQIPHLCEKHGFSFRKSHIYA